LDEQSKATEFQYNLLKNNLKAILLDLSGDVLPAINQALKSVTAAMAEQGGMSDDLTRFFGSLIRVTGDLIGITGGLMDKLQGLSSDTKGLIGDLANIIETIEMVTGVLDALAKASSWDDLTKSIDSVSLSLDNVIPKLQTFLRILARGLKVGPLGIAMKPILDVAETMAGATIKTGELAPGGGWVPKMMGDVPFSLQTRGDTPTNPLYVYMTNFGLPTAGTSDTGNAKQMGKRFGKDFWESIIATGIGAAAGGGGMRGVMQGVLPIVGMALGGPVGGAVGGWLGSLFRKGRGRGDTPTNPQYVHIVNTGDLVTTFLNLTKQLRLMATGPGMQHLVTNLQMQAARVGVS